MRQPKWDKYETALLIEAYWRIKAESSKKKQIIAELSAFLRNRANFAIDDTFRNENGINMSLNELEYLFSGGNVGLKNVSGVFREIVALYKNDKHEFDKILLEANEITLTDKNSHSEAKQNSKKFDDNFYQWLFKVEGLAVPTCRSYVSALHVAENFAKFNILEVSVLCTFDSEAALGTIGALMEHKGFLRLNQLQHNRFSAAFQKLKCFFAYLESEITETDSVKQTPSEDSFCEKRVSDIGELISLVDKLIKDSEHGITKEELCKQFSNYNTHQINLAIEACHAVLVLKKYHHRENISDYNEMSDILLDVIKRQFSKNGDYTSAKQLYAEARFRLDDFFFYNNAFDSRQEVYDLAMHLFVQEKYKGNTFIFMNGMHIWKEEPDYPKDYHGLLIKFAREHGNFFAREDALAYFEQIGSTSSNATFSNVIFSTGSKSFLQFAENQFVLTEALNINEDFLFIVKTQIENLLAGEDYVATGMIDDYFYTTLPALPSGIFWSALLIEDILRVYDIGFMTIEAGHDNDKKTLPAAIVRKNSPYKRFSDIVWNEVAKSFSLPKEFTAPEFREFLLAQGFIRGLEKMWSVHKTVSEDIRFYWTEQNGRVTIN